MHKSDSCALLLIEVLILFVVASGAVNDTECANLAASANCSFYEVCIEAVAPCGKHGYAEKYGKKYCERFDEPEYKDRFDKKASVAVGTEID